ncbi:MAG: hypothetical protein ABW135_03705 [Thermoleophilaceae bacterium]
MRTQEDGPTEAVLVLSTLGAAERRLLGGRRPQTVEAAAPEPVPTARVTIVAPEPFATPEAASAWLARRRRDSDAAEADLATALETLNRALRAQRAAAADPYLGELSADRALVARIGYGRGDSVADGRFGEAFELPRARPRRIRRSMEAPEERFAALLGARERALVAEELVLRARADLDAGCMREAALQARIALEALIAELADSAPALGERRAAAGEAANAALRGELSEAAGDGVREAVAAMEAALRRHRLGS